jgi:acyl carrier protein phosphodiesterase
MNFLAHLFLSGNFDELMIGNLMADFVKGNAFTNMGDQIVKGIELHREIDYFTDFHPIVRESKSRLYPTYHHYASVIVDVYYDHFLAANWHDYAVQPLPEYAQQVYQLLRQKYEKLPSIMHPMVDSMQNQNWLLAYASLDNLEGVFQRMSRRTRFVSNMETAANDLRQDYALYKAEFDRFFPALIAHVAKVKAA